MRCSIPIMITEELRLTVTEFDHIPAQKLSFNCEYLPEHFEVVNGYLEDIDDNELTRQDFWEAVEKYDDLIIKAVSEYFYEEDDPTGFVFDYDQKRLL